MDRGTKGTACVMLVVRQEKGAQGGAKGMRPCARCASGVGEGGRGGTHAGSGVRETVWHSRAMPALMCSCDSLTRQSHLASSVVELTVLVSFPESQTFTGHAASN